MVAATVAPHSQDRASGGLQVSRWQQRAACRPVPTTLFYPVGHSNQLAEDRAKTVCAACPVRVPCLAFAIEYGESFGIWGGMTPEERQALVAQGEER